MISLLRVDDYEITTTTTTTGKTSLVRVPTLESIVRCGSVSRTVQKLNTVSRMWISIYNV